MKKETRPYTKYENVYIANDGTEFSDEQECIKYEGTARAVIKCQAKKLITKTDYGERFACVYFGCDDALLIYHPKTKDDIDAMNRYLKEVFRYNDDRLLTYKYVGKKILIDEYYTDEGWLVGTKEELIKMFSDAVETLFADEKKKEEDVKDESVSD